jgi:hypothetical protein
MTDARVTAAAEHWADRFTANGTDYADVRDTLRRVEHWEDWCREWGRTASRYEEFAESAGETGEKSQPGAWRRAALCWHWGKFVFTDYPDGNHGVTNHAFESRSLMADWLAARLT